MANTTAYDSRVFDVLAFRGAKSTGDILLTQSLFDAEAGGEICTGVQKLAQRWALEFLTQRGSMGFHMAARGTQFMTWAIAGRLRTEYDVQTYFGFAANQAKVNLLNEETADMHPEERFESAVLDRIEIAENGFALYVTITSQAGDSRAVILPVASVPGALSV